MAERHDPYISLRNTRFLWYVASLVAMTLGTQIQATVVAWQGYALTKDPLSLGLVGLAEALPYGHGRQLRELEQSADAQPVKLLKGDARQRKQGDG